MNLVFTLLRGNQVRPPFHCGEYALDHYWQVQAGQDSKRGFASVVTATDNENPEVVVGYYTLSAASVPLLSLPEELTRRMPHYPAVPAVRMGRLAVATEAQNQHIGSLLVLDALRRSCRSELAWALFLVDAKNQRVVSFYEKFLFQAFQDSPLHLWMSRKQADKLAQI